VYERSRAPIGVPLPALGLKVPPHAASSTAPMKMLVKLRKFLTYHILRSARFRR
jgi:hypothetical protein